MKKTTALLLSALLTMTTPVLRAQTHQPAVENTAGEMVFLETYYSETFKRLEKNVNGLTQAQLNYKPAADRWSISECLEHIVLTEKMLFDFAKKAMTAPANPERRSEVEATDQQIVDGVVDRSEKFKAPEMLQATGKYKDAEAALDELKKQRAEILAYLATTTPEELRNHITDAPKGAVDAYQSFLFIAGHTARHTLQIEEVKASPGFPE